MRILFLSVAVPFPCTNGFTMRTWSVIEALSKQGHELHLLAFGTKEQLSTSELKAACKSATVVEHEAESLSSSKQYLPRILALPWPMPFSVTRFRSREMNHAIQGALDTLQPDAIVCDTVFALVNLPATNVPTALNTHNVEHLILQRFAENDGNLATRGYAWLESLKLKAWEKKACRRSNSVMACSDVDGDILAELSGHENVFTVPNTIDVSRYSNRSNEEEEKTVLFTGGMDWYPNRDAVQYFAEQILPHLLQLAPGVKFVVAGRDGTPDFRRSMARFPNLRFTGRVNDMRDEIARATVCVVPLRIGSGTRLKILEAGAMHKAMVSTTIGAEGLQLADTKEIFLADQPEQFAQHVAQLLHDKELRRSMGFAARRRVEQQYSREALDLSIRRALEATRVKVAASATPEYSTVS